MGRLSGHIISALLLLATAQSSFSQAVVSVKASINRDKILIGEGIELKLEAKVPAGTEGNWFPIDSMQHFEFIDKGKIDTIGSEGGRTLRQTLVITSFDSGRWSVPALPFTVGNKEYLTDSLPVSVAYINFDPKQDYHDIKDIIEVEYTALTYINWVLLGVALLSLGAVVYFMSRNTSLEKAAVAVKPVSNLSPLEEALAAIASLEQRGHTEALRTKLFHTELNDVLRNYVARRTGLVTMEKTSGELMMQLKSFRLLQNEFTALAQVLRMNDAVKFAKYQPAEEENQQAIRVIRDSITRLDAII